MSMTKYEPKTRQVQLDLDQYDARLLHDVLVDFEQLARQSPTFNTNGHEDEFEYAMARLDKLRDRLSDLCDQLEPEPEV